MVWTGQVWRILQSEYFFRPNRLRGREARLDGFFVDGTEPATSLFSSQYSFPCGVFLNTSMFDFICRWFFTSTLSKIEYKVEPDRSLQLCWISAVGRTEFTTFVQTLDLLFGDRLLVNHASYLFPSFGGLSRRHQELDWLL